MKATSSSTYVIAEAGVNHNGSLERAVRMVDVAAKAGADAIKFQTFRTNDLVTEAAPQADYQTANKGPGSQRELLSRLELSAEAHRELKKRCAALGIEFLSTPFDEDSLDLLVNELEVERIKISSGDVTNFPLLRRVGQTHLPVILSTGMADLGEVEDAIEVLLEHGSSFEAMTLLHCTTEYPAPLASINLRAMLTLSSAYGLPVGYSDHSMGVEVSLAAVALGATIIEKHFTLDRSLEGPDHRASLEPGELESMIRQIRNVEQALGDGRKRAQSAEASNRLPARRSLVAALPIAAGELFTEESFRAKRPGNGLSPMRWPELIGKPARRDYQADEPID